MGSAGHSLTDTIDVSNGTSYGMLAFWANSNIFGSSATPGAADNGIDFSNVQVEKIAGLVWSNTGSGDWGNAGNWTGGVAPNGGASALLGSAATADATVNLDTATTVGILTFDNSAANYTINSSSSNSLTLDASVGSTHVQVLAGSHVITAPVTLADDTNVHITSAASTLTMPELNAPGRRITKSGAGTLAIGGFSGDRLAVNAGTVAVAANGTPAGMVNVKSLVVATGAKLNMNDNDMIVDYTLDPSDPTDTSPEFTLRDKVLLARDGDAEGIFFTGSDDDFSDKVLAFGEAAELGFTEFNGVTVDDSTVLGKYTYYGDANFDGQVTTDDYVAVDLGLGTGDSWVQGDFDLNGVVTTDDYVVVDLNLGKGSGDPLAFAEEQAAMIALHTEMFGQSYVEKLTYASEHGWVAASVPEPGGLAVTLLLGLAGRRRRV
jgi:hypothetical protein